MESPLNLFALKPVSCWIFPGVDQCLGVYEGSRVAPKRWSTPILFFVYFLRSLFFFPVIMGNYVKMLKKMISNSERSAKHPFADQNTQNITQHKWYKLMAVSSSDIFSN